MASRPYLNKRGKELLAIFKNGKQDAKVLVALRAELTHRNGPSMGDLRIQVDEALARLETAPTTQFPDIDEMHDPIRRARGTVGSIRPCGAISGVPSRWTFPGKHDFDLQVGKNATRVEKFVAALRALVKDMRKRGSGMRTVSLEHGEGVPLDGRERGYRFPYDGDAELFEGAKVTIAIGNRTCNGRIVSVSTQWLVASFEEDLGPTIRTCVLRIDNTAMIDALADRLDKVRNGEAKLNQTLADDVLDNREAQVEFSGAEHSPKTDRKLNTQQKEFVDHAIANAVTYLWGPPGTGKTRSLSSLIELLFDSGKRALICSNTNQAVDQVLISLCETLRTTHSALHDGRVIRIGKTEGIPSKFTEFVTLDGIVRRKSVDLQRRKSLLESEIQRLRQSASAANRILDAFKRLDDLERARDDLTDERAALEKALADAETALRQITNSVGKLERELSDRLGAGLMRRLLMRAEATIRADLSKAHSQMDAARSQSESHRAALQDAEWVSREREVVAQHGKLAAALQHQNRGVAKRQVDDTEEKHSAALRELADINRTLEGIEKAVVAEAKIVGATVTKTYLTPQQFTHFDVVIIDEASMVMLPAIYYVSGLAKEKVIVSGDFRQLSPIVPTEQAAIQEVIGSDVFQMAGITEAVKAHRTPKRTVMLTDQYRMNDAICRLISARMYDDRLRTQAHVKAEEARPPAPFGGSLTVIDTSPVQPFVNRHGSSRYNLMNALTIRNLVRHLRETGFVAGDGGSSADQSRLGVCTPFAAQRDVLKRLTSATGVVVGTVHRYQGDEKRAMVIDIPDSLGEHHVSLFAQAGSPEDAGAKLFNVAVSRAEEHIIFVANLDYLDAKLPADAFLRELLHEVSTRGRIVDVRDVLALWPIADDLQRIGRPFALDPETLRSGLFRQADFDAVCGADIEKATKGIAIYSGFVTPQRVAAYEPLFRRKLSESVKIRCVTRPPARNGSIPADLGRDALDGLEAMGCIVDTRWDIHEKVVIIDDEIIWFGSLNPLSHTNRTDEMMARVTGKPAALQLSAFMAVATSVKPDKADGLSVLGENPHCPDCGSRTTYRLGSYGPFWQCEDGCGWKRNFGRTNDPRKPASDKELLPKTGPACSKCGGPTILRHGPHGHFYGCTKYPACRGVGKESGYVQHN